MTKVRKVLIITAISAVVAIGITTNRNHDLCNEAFVFDQVAWEQGLEDFIEGGQRYPFAKELLHCETLIGLKEADLLAMLGTPQTSRLGTHYNYWLGMEHEAYFGIDSDWLSVWLENGTVVKAGLNTD